MVRRLLSALILCCAALGTPCPASALEPPTVIFDEKTPGVRWTFPIGHRRGLIAVDDKRVVVATNQLGKVDESKGDWKTGGSLVAVDRASGKQLWQIDHSQREKGERPSLGIQSQPRIDGEHVYYISNRGELVCANLETGKIAWQIDMVRELDICFAPDFALSNPFCSPLVHGDHVYCVTGNGTSHSSPLLREVYGDKFMPRAASPHFICVHKATGKLVWSSNLPRENAVYSWSSPVACKLVNRDAIAFPGGDGVLYFFDPLRGELLEKYDLVPGDKKSWNPPEKSTAVFPVATPVFADGLLFVSTAQDMYGYPEFAPFTAFDLTGERSSPQSRLLWKIYEHAYGWTRTAPALTEKLLFVYDEDLHTIVAVERRSGKLRARRDAIDSEPTAFASLTVVGDHLLANIGASIEIYSADDKLFHRRTVKFAGGRCGLMGPVVMSGDEIFVAAAGQVFALDRRAVLGPLEDK